MSRISLWPLGLILLTPSLCEAQGWYNTGGNWAHRKSVTIDHTKVSGSLALTNFPVLISVTDANLQASAQSSGNDILFTAGDGVTKLPRTRSRSTVPVTEI